jgi:glyoxylase-like metal-dependent hydrolase (beta-lactamase superfamily II)
MTKLGRRDFFVTSSLAFGTLAQTFAQNAPAAPAPQPPQTSFDPLRGNVGVFSGRGGTIGMLVSSDGVVVVDTQFQDTAKIALGNLQQWTSRKIDFLINTHHHGDHTSGNIVFKPAVLKIVAHRNVPALQQKQAAGAKSDDQQVYADTTYDTTWSQKVGTETISLKYYGAGHTSGDSVVTFQNANIVHMGDLLFYLRNPRVDRPAGASVKNWIVLLETVAKEHPADTIYIAGHSKMNLPITVARAEILKFRDYFTALLSYVQKGIASGRSAAEIVKVASVPGFADYEGSPEGTIQAAYDELTAKG